MYIKVNLSKIFCDLKNGKLCVNAFDDDFESVVVFFYVEIRDEIYEVSRFCWIGE